MTANQITKNMYTLFYGKSRPSQANGMDDMKQDDFLNWLNKNKANDMSAKSAAPAPLTNRSTHPVAADSIKSDTLEPIFTIDNQGLTGYEQVTYFMDYSNIEQPRIIMKTTLCQKDTYYEMDPANISGDRASNSELLGYYAFLQAQGEDVDMEQLMATMNNALCRELLPMSSCTSEGFLTVPGNWYEITETMQQSMRDAGDIENATKTEKLKEQLPKRLPFDSIEEWMSFIKAQKDEIYEKLLTGQTQPTIATGAASFTQEEWDKMIQKIDENIDEIKEELKQKEEKAKEEEITKEMLKKLLMDKELLKPDGKNIITDIDIAAMVIGITHTETFTQVTSTEGSSHLLGGWYITAYTDQGIECRYCKQGEPSQLLWSISYNNSEDRKRVERFLERFEPDDNLSFASNKNFWQDFLAKKIDEEDYSNY